MNWKLLLIGMAVVVGSASAATIFNDSFNYTPFNTTRWSVGAGDTAQITSNYMDVNPVTWFLGECVTQYQNSSGEITISHLKDMFMQTVTMWYRGSNAPEQTLGDNPTNAYLLQIDTLGTGTLFSEVGGGYSVEATDATFSTTGWHNITIVDNPSTNLIKVYEDGALKISQVPANTFAITESAWGLCWGSNAASQYTIDEITVTDATPEAPLADTTPPTWSAFQRNATSPTNGAAVLFSAAWADDTALANYTFEFDNGNGTLQNSTRSFTGVANTSNESRSVQFGTVRYRFYGRDATGNMNATTQASFSVTDVAAPRFSLQAPANGTGFTQGDNVPFSAYWTDDLALQSFTLETNMSGSMANTTVFFTGIANWSNYTVNAPNAGVFVWRLWANDTTGNRNKTAFLILTVSPVGDLGFQLQNIDRNNGWGDFVGWAISATGQGGISMLDQSFNNIIKLAVAAVILMLAAMLAGSGSGIAKTLKKAR